MDGKDPYNAALNICRGKTLKGDTYKIDMLDSGKTIYSTAMTFGMPADLVRHSQNLRPIFGRYRYIAQGTKNFIMKWSMPVFKSDIYYKQMENCTAKSSPSKPFKKTQRVDCPNKNQANIPKTMTFNKMSKCDEKNTEQEWKKLPFNEFLFHAVVTHEIRSSVNNEITAPFSKIDDK